MYTIVVDAAVTNIPLNFSTGSGTKIISNAPTGGSLIVINTTTSKIYIVWQQHKVGVVPSSTLPGSQFPVAAAPTGGTSAVYGDLLKITKGDDIFIRADPSVSTGTVTLCIV